MPEAPVQIAAGASPRDEESEHSKRGLRRFVPMLVGHEAGYIVILFLAIFLIYLFGFRGMRFFAVPSSSMYPTLMRGDQICTLNEVEYSRGDIVVVYDRASDENIVKRIAGLPQDSLQVMGGSLYINGEFASEPYIAEPMAYMIVDPFRVPDGQVFLLGDNRNISDDSSVEMQTWRMSDIIGRVRFIYFPYNRFGRVRSYPLVNINGG